MPGEWRTAADQGTTCPRMTYRYSWSSAYFPAWEAGDGRERGGREAHHHIGECHVANKQVDASAKAGGPQDCDDNEEITDGPNDCDEPIED